jgi:hypothetical protein
MIDAVAGHCFVLERNDRMDNVSIDYYVRQFSSACQMYADSTLEASRNYMLDRATAVSLGNI